MHLPLLFLLVIMQTRISNVTSTVAEEQVVGTDTVTETAVVEAARDLPGERWERWSDFLPTRYTCTLWNYAWKAWPTFHSSSTAPAPGNGLLPPPSPARPNSYRAPCPAQPQPAPGLFTVAAPQQQPIAAPPAGPSSQHQAAPPFQHQVHHFRQPTNVLTHQPTSTWTWPSMAPVTPNNQPTTIPQTYNTVVLQDLTSNEWHIDSGATSHLHANTCILTSISNKCLIPSVFVGDVSHIPVT